MSSLRSLLRAHHGPSLLRFDLCIGDKVEEDVPYSHVPWAGALGP